MQGRVLSPYISISFVDFFVNTSRIVRKTTVSVQKVAIMYLAKCY